MTIAVPSGAFVSTGAGPVWRRHLLALAIACGAILAIFHEDVGKLADLWWISTTFGHCLFIGPVLGWVVTGHGLENGLLTGAVAVSVFFTLAFAGGLAGRRATRDPAPARVAG